ncbi:unnamed protein product [Symbiodinium natans]|uniref:Uncharacterized protein n=1 Tax=Symbiodinium natans TaxID=878477 RepID=A0A812HNM8_9DINO|nr:unnamed protein product [Symbiodinium natans]
MPISSLGSLTPRVSGSAWVAPGAQVVGDVRLGQDVGVWFNCVLRGDDSHIEVGDGTNIQDLTMVHLDEGLPCIIGRKVSVGHACVLHGCTVEDEVLVGMGAIILNKAVIGRGSVVGAGALVLEGMKVPPFSLVVGSPAQVKKTYSETERLQAQHRHAEKYAKKAARFRQEMALVDKGDDQTANNITLDIILAVACGALVLAALCAARRG